MSRRGNKSRTPVNQAPITAAIDPDAVKAVLEMAERRKQSQELAEKLQADNEEFEKKFGHFRNVYFPENHDGKKVFLPFALRRYILSSYRDLSESMGGNMSDQVQYNEMDQLKRDEELALVKIQELYCDMEELASVYPSLLRTFCSLECEDYDEFVLSEYPVEECGSLGAIFHPLLVKLESEVNKMLAKFDDVDDNTTFTLREFILFLNRKPMYMLIEENGSKFVVRTYAAKLVETMMGSYLEVLYEVMHSTKDGFRHTKTALRLAAFGGTSSMKEIGVKAIDPKSDEAKLYIERGRQIMEMAAKPAYVRVEGAQVRRSWMGPSYFRATGRFMVDHRNMKEMDPNYRYYFAENRYRDDDDETSESVVTDEHALICAPFLYGFSFVTKRWGEVSFSQVKDIEFRDDAFDKLVMDKSKKEMIHSLVDHKYTGKTDLIDGKGNGVIFLLAGEPGVGKTATAETVSETLHRPLYMVSVGELGTDPESLDANLSKVLEVATAWNAVLLLDEADIFMEERSDMDVHRNAMVGIFLRLLEYYNGVLFLTTNRASNIDRAFFSRISLSLHYPKLSQGDRTKIWTNITDLFQIRLTQADLDQLSVHDINGRQIKNVVRMANALASKTGEKVTAAHLERVINHSVEFEKSVSIKRDIFSRIWRFLKGSR